jgi:hypothetical protein
MNFTVSMDRNSVSNPDHFLTKIYTYKYHQGYGSPQVSKETSKPAQITVSEDGKEISLTYNKMTPRRVYEFNLSSLLTADGGKLVNSLVAYHAHNLRK